MVLVVLVNVTALKSLLLSTKTVNGVPLIISPRAKLNAYAPLPLKEVVLYIVIIEVATAIVTVVEAPSGVMRSLSKSTPATMRRASPISVKTQPTLLPLSIPLIASILPEVDEPIMSLISTLIILYALVKKEALVPEALE